MILYLKYQRANYQRARKKRKTELLNEFCETFGYHRKAAIRLLRMRQYETVPNFVSSFGDSNCEQFSRSPFPCNTYILT